MPANDLQDTPAEELTGKVVCIEDEPINLAIVEELLKQFPKVQLITATTGAEGVRLVREHRPDFVLLDMHLPDIDGLRLLELAKGETHSAHIPVIVVSADALSEQVQAALRAGAVAYVTKPLNLDDTLREVDRVLAAR